MKEIAILLSGTFIAGVFVVYLQIPDDFFERLVSLNIAILMGTGALFLAISNLIIDRDGKEIKKKILKFISISYPAFFIVNILMLLIGMEITVFSDVDRNESFLNWIYVFFKSLGLFITCYCIWVIASLFKEALTKIK